jgi:glutathione S-transferase
MKLYLAPGACSLALHIALHEAGIVPETVKVDIPTRKTETGADFTTVNPKGYVPALILDDGEMLTENVALLDWVTGEVPDLAPTGKLGRTRLLEMLTFISTEIHKPFIRLFFAETDAEKAMMTEALEGRFAYLADRWSGDYLIGNRYSVADCFLHVTLRWAAMMGLKIPATLQRHSDRMASRPAVLAALAAEGIN